VLRSGSAADAHSNQLQAQNGTPPPTPALATSKRCHACQCSPLLHPRFLRTDCRTATPAQTAESWSRHVSLRALRHHRRPVASRPASAPTGHNALCTLRKTPTLFFFPPSQALSIARCASRARRDDTRQERSWLDPASLQGTQKNSRGKKGNTRPEPMRTQAHRARRPRESLRKAAQSTATPRVAGRHMARKWTRQYIARAPAPGRGRQPASTSKPGTDPPTYFCVFRAPPPKKVTDHFGIVGRIKPWNPRSWTRGCAGTTLGLLQHVRGAFLVLRTGSPTDSKMRDVAHGEMPG
jgi:hypothetical protein